jgi:catechol 2,3-dioxygenase-like lactoylglutathione lyase family enzyme
MRAAACVPVFNPEDRTMLNQKETMATIAVTDLPRARQFYEGTLALRATGAEGDDVLTFASGAATLLVYRSQFAGTNQATSMTWNVGTDIDPIVAGLKARGVQFEHYDLPGMVRDGDIHSGGTIRAAWFKDPDGNILNLAGA